MGVGSGFAGAGLVSSRNSVVMTGPCIGQACFGGGFAAGPIEEPAAPVATWQIRRGDVLKDEHRCAGSGSRREWR